MGRGRGVVEGIPQTGAIQWNFYTVVTVGPTFCGFNIDGGCTIVVHNTLAICTMVPIKVALIERWLLYRVITL